MGDHIWVMCPNGHGKPGQQHFDYCGLCPECGAVLMEVAEPRNPYREGAAAAEGHYTGNLSYEQSQCPYPKGSEEAAEWHSGNDGFYRALDDFWAGD